MRAAQNIQLYSLVLLLLSTFTAAWPWPRWLPDVDSLVVRQNDNSDQSSSSSPTQTPSPSATNTNSNTDSDSESKTDTASNTKKSSSSGSSGTAKQTGSTTKGGSSTHKSTSTAPHTTSYDARLPAGGISLLTPNVESGSQFYKIGDFVTFAWNYTSLSATPTALDIMATCTANKQMYTIAMNQTITNATGAVTWDTNAYQQTALSDPLLTEVYTLIIYDAASSISAAPQAGYLAPFDSFVFGMYTPQAYTPLNEYQCATCSGALSDMERRALGMVFGVACITVLSFTWFVGGSGVIW
ncbi:hypothetical protein D0Z07_5595 [Hyphodiscus hymeniophilus]|uniref:DUF7137 domain-containing protein n=1 Tax=Hyphodiscus hymeniophilus TaxID=353542 RepID=A0A9P6VJ33_9HELO|nr:hypothetical protein D0Z07_5595 [Hyphodiscus hymeniophilus]